MCIALKYGIWNVSEPERNAVNSLVDAGYSPLTAMILSSRGMKSPDEARSCLSCDSPLPDPFLMTDMDRAALRQMIGLVFAGLDLFRCDDAAIPADQLPGYRNRADVGEHCKAFLKVSRRP